MAGVPKHGAAIGVDIRDLSVVAGVDGAECGVQRVAGAPPAQLHVCI